MSQPHIILVITDQYLKDAMIDWRQNSLLETMDLHGASR
jgi:hypothetical protein